MTCTSKALFLTTTLFASILFAAPKNPSLAFPVITPEFIALEPNILAERFDLIIQGPNGQHFTFTYHGFDVPYLQLNDLGELAEGIYHFDLVARPFLSDEARTDMRQHRDQRTQKTSHHGDLPDEIPLNMSGWFRIQKGAFYVPQSTAAEIQAHLNQTDPQNPYAATDQDQPGRALTLNDNVIVEKSQCLGVSCVVGEDFVLTSSGITDTFRFKENNLRIHFDDNSEFAGYPNNDWRIVFNSSQNGGDSYFQIQDVTADQTPFQIMAGSRNHAFVIDAQGDVGIGTQTPTVELQVRTDNNPVLRLDQSAQSGWQPKIWNVGGNELDFFISETTVSNGGAFRIRAGSTVDTFTLDNGYGVGINTREPDATFHLRGLDGQSYYLLHLEEKNSTAADRDMFELSNVGGSEIQINDTNSNKTWQLKTFSNTDTLSINFVGTTGDEFELSGSGNLNISGDIVAGGTIVDSSDRNIKENFKAINHFDILHKVSNLDIQGWNYIGDLAERRHIGPMAQDFHAAFELGKDDKHISMVDGNGIAFAAIKALKQINDTIDAEIALLEQQSHELNERLLSLEARLKRLNKWRPLYRIAQRSTIHFVVNTTLFQRIIRSIRWNVLLSFCYYRPYFIQQCCWLHPKASL